MARRPTTPQEKKRLAYERDQRGAYFNSAHGARTSIPKRKRHQARRERQAVSNVLPQAGAPDDVVAQLEAAEVQLSGARSTGRLKTPGLTLREWVDGRLERREKHERRAIRPQDKRPPQGRQRRDRYELRWLDVDGRLVFYLVTADGTPVRKPRHSSRARASWFSHWYRDDIADLIEQAATSPARSPACPATGSRSDPARP